MVSTELMRVYMHLPKSGKNQFPSQSDPPQEFRMLEDKTHKIMGELVREMVEKALTSQGQSPPRVS